MLAPVIIVGNGCKIGRRCMISAKNEVLLEANVLLGPSVLITDHSHEFYNLDLPIHAQGLTKGGKVSLLNKTVGLVTDRRSCVILVNL